MDGAAASPGQVLAAAHHTLHVQFTPSDTAHYLPPRPLTRPLLVETAPVTLTAKDEHMTYGEPVPPSPPRCAA